MRRPMPQVCFLAGSGISVPSGLPTAWAFNKALASYLCDARAGRHRLIRLLITGQRADPERQLRFERVIQVLRDTVDRDLSILNLFETCLGPSYLHRFLAHALRTGSPVFTTNFDCLIEAAYLVHGSPSHRETQLVRPDLMQVVYDTLPARLKDHPSIGSFASWRRIRTIQAALFKLHGSVHDIEWILSPNQNSSTIIDSVNATLDSIGNRRRLWSLEPNKANVLRVQLKDRLLIVLGYSGLDDFDVIPTVIPLLPLTRGLILISHHHIDNIRVIRVDKSATGVPLPPGFVPALASGVPIWVVCGRTDAIIRSAFSYNVPAAEAVPDFTEYRLMTLPTYKQLPKAERRRIVARLFEVAGDLGKAEREYQLAIQQLSHLPHLRTALAYCYNRLGAIQWRRGFYRAALVSTRWAEVLNRRLRNRGGVAAALNNRGYAFMSMGDLAHAKRCFKHSYDLHKELGDRAAMARNLANIGIVARRQGDIDAAYHQFRRALALSSNARDLEGVARDLGNLGNIHLAKKRYSRAMKAYAKSYRLARQIGLYETMAIQLGNMGIAQRHRKRLGEALRHFRVALRMNKQLGRTEGVIDNVGNIAAALGDQGRNDKAIREFDRAIALARKIGEREGLAVNYEMKGNLLKKMGHKGRARTAFRASLKHYQKLGNRRKTREISKVLQSLESS